MPVTVSHVLSMTTPDNTSYECKPSNWNSAHAFTLNATGSEISGAFSNANGLSFGLSAGAITASYTTPGATVFSNSNNVSFGLSGSTVTATVTVPAQTNQTLGLYASSNTTGQSSSSTMDARTLSIRGAGIASVGFSAGELVVSVPSGGGVGDGGIGLSAGASSLSAGTVVFSNSNGVSFGLNGSTVTASHNGLTTAALSNHSHGNPTLNLTNLSGTTASASNGLTLSLSAGAQTNQTVGVYASSNTVGQSSSSTLDARTLSFRGAGIASVGFSAGEVIVSVPSAGGSVNFSAGTTSNNLNAVTFSNANGVSFGLNASTITGSVAAQTNQSMGLYASSQTVGQSSSSTVDARSLSIVGRGIISVGMSAGSLLVSASAAGAADGYNLIAAGTQTANTTGTIRFSNSNGITFGMSNSSIVTASHNGLTSQSNQALSGSNGSFAFQTATFGNLNGLSFYTSNGSLVGSYTAPDVGTVSAGTSIATLGQILLADSNGISFGGSNNTITASYNPFGGGISGGNTAGNTGTVASRMFLAGGANITLSGSSNGGSITVSVVGGAGGGGGAAISAGTQSVSTGTVAFSNSNGITFGMSGSNTITASHNGLTSQSNQAASAANGSFTFQTVSFSNVNGVSFGTSAGSAITASVAAQTAQTLGLYASSNTTGQSSSTTVDARTLSIRGIGIASVGYSAGELLISVPAAGGSVNFSAGTTSNNLNAVTFSNSNGVSFGLNASTITGSVAAQTNQTVGLYALGNTTQNSSTTFDARTLSFNALGAMTAGYSNGSIQLSAPATSSLSATGILSISTNGSTISLGVPGGTQSFWNPYDVPSTTGSQIGNGSVFVQPMVNLHGNVSFSRLDLFASMSVSSSSNSSHAGALSFTAAIYTRNGSTLSLASSGSQSYQWSNTSNNSMASVASMRRFSIPLNANITEGNDYWIAIGSRSSTTNANWFTASNVRVTAHTDLMQGLIGEASNQTRQMMPGYGLWSTTSAALPASIALGDIRGIGSGVANNALPVFVNANNFTA